MVDVPSNLVPTRVTELPTYGGVDSSGWVPYVIGGVTYKAQLSQMTYLGVVTSVNASGGTTGFSFSGGPITTTGTLTLEGTLAIANGGTGSTTAALARAALLPTYAGNANKALRVNAGATDVEWVLDGGGTVTSVGQTFTGGLISVGGSPITGAGTLALTVAGTSGGVPYFNSAAAWSSSAVLVANSLMVGGGAGAAPATVTTGTGVLTALGINVGSAGAFVAFNGALGTPSSGNLSNCTSYPVSGLTGLGTGVAAALAINVGSAGAFVAFNGALGTPSSGDGSNITNVNAATLGGATFAAPGAIGSGTPGSGAFTTLSATTSVAAPTATLGTQQTTQGSLVLANTAAGAFATTLRSSNSASAAWALTFPTTAGSSGQVLSTDGSGVTSWITPSTGIVPMFSAINASNQSISTGTLTELNVTASYQFGTCFAANAYTVPAGKAGWHRFMVVPDCNATALTAAAVAIYVGGSIASKSLRFWGVAASTEATPTYIFEINLAEGDVVTARIRIDGTSPVIGGSSDFNSSFSGDWLRAA